MHSPVLHFHSLLEVDSWVLKQVGSHMKLEQVLVISAAISCVYFQSNILAAGSIPMAMGQHTDIHGNDIGFCPIILVSITNKLLFVCNYAERFRFGKVWNYFIFNCRRFNVLVVDPSIFYTPWDILKTPWNP